MSADHDQSPHTSTYPLFEHMQAAHGLTLTESEMEEIIAVVKKVIYKAPHPAVSELKPVVLYLGSEAERDDFARMVAQAFPNLKPEKL